MDTAAKQRDRRRNLAESVKEDWRPPLHSANNTPLKKFLSALRRFFDLQAGTIWKDLGRALPAVGGSVLDVGCGAQPYRSLFPAGVTYVAIDTSDARDHFGYEVPDTLYYSGDRWPVPDESVDLVLCAEVLEHVLDPALFLSEANRCLRPGGTVLLTVPFAARWHFIPYDYWRYTPSGLKHLFARAGFGEIVVHARGNPLTVACYKCMALLLPLIFPQNTSLWHGWTRRIFGLPTLPLLFMFAAVANLTCGADWGNDCLGYTVSARRRPAE